MLYAGLNEEIDDVLSCRYHFMGPTLEQLRKQEKKSKEESMLLMFVNINRKGKGIKIETLLTS